MTAPPRGSDERRVGRGSTIAYAEPLAVIEGLALGRAALVEEVLPTLGRPEEARLWTQAGRHAHAAAAEGVAPERLAVAVRSALGRASIDDNVQAAHATTRTIASLAHPPFMTSFMDESSRALCRASGESERRIEAERRDARGHPGARRGRERRKERDGADDRRRAEQRVGEDGDVVVTAPS